MKAVFCSTLPPAWSGKGTDPFGRHGWSLSLLEPVQAVTAEILEQVTSLVDWAEEQALAGRYVALAIAYEAAPAFDPVLAVHRERIPGEPLAVAASFDQPGQEVWKADMVTEGPWPDGWEPLVSREAYRRAIGQIREYVRQGECYQINYTIPFETRFQGPPEALFHRLAARQGAGFCAHLSLGGKHVLSLSPELFFMKKGDHIESRPMKGTRPRGRFPEEDLRLAQEMRSSAKERAENVMIVDLMRNDLGRLARAGSVEACDLFRVERYPTMLQMTSTVRARLRQDVRLRDIFGAVFPCGSITGAPKVRAMELIAELESHPRGFYCGAMGFLTPGGDGVFNVPIRTLSHDAASGHTRFHVGGGITYDSVDRAEYEECATKMRFLTHKACSQKPFRLLETMLLRQGRVVLLDRHLDRLLASADYFGFVHDQTRLRVQLEQVVAGQPPQARRLLRLLMDKNGEVEIQSRELAAGTGRPRRVAWPPWSVDSSDTMLFHKTDQRDMYDAALASRPDADDVLLANERGEITESCIASIVVRHRGRLITPAITCGLLDGTLRRHLLDKGVLEEGIVTGDMLETSKWWLINSVRGWMLAELLRA